MNDDGNVSEPVAVILARMEVKLDHALSQAADHETRIRALEKRVWVASGLASVLASVGVTYLNTLIGG